MSDPHNSIGGTLDRVLHSLRDADPPTQMQQRLLANLANHRVQTQSRPARKWFFFLSAPVLVLSAVVFTVLDARTFIHAPVSPVPSTTIATTSSSLQTPTTLATFVVHRPVHHRVGPKPETPVALIVLPPEDQLALDDFHAPSQVAPPLALTAAERSLQRAAQSHNEVELAELLPSTREAHLAAERASFKKFFTPPPPIPQPQALGTQSNGDPIQ